MTDVDAPFGQSEGFRQGQLGTVDWLMLLLAFGLSVAHGLSVFLFASFTPRMALLFMAGCPGLVCLARLARRGDAADRLAALLVIWTVVASLASGAVILALKGSMGSESSGLIFVLAVGVWALGRCASHRAVAALPVAILIGLALSALVGVLQVVLNVESGPFALQFSRATGLTPSPVYFGSLCAAGAALAVGQSCWPLFARVAVTACFAAATNLSGSRVALVAGLAAVAAGALTPAALMSYRRRVSLLMAYIGGVCASVVLTTATSSARTSTARLVSADGGGSRRTAWRYGIEAIVDRPVFGWGMGRFRAATQARYSPDFVREAASDDLQQAWFDAHNIAIQLAVGIGVVGLLIASVWLVRSMIDARGPLVFPLIALGLAALFQPAGLAVLPLSMLMFGAATRRERVDRRDRSPMAALVALMLGVMLAGWLAIGDMRLSAVVDARDVVAIEDRASWFPGDAVVADAVAQSWFLRAQIVPGLESRVFEWSERAISADPDRPYLRSAYAGRLLAFERYGEAREQIDQSLTLEPWHLQSWQVAYVLALRTDDAELMKEATSRLCRLGQPLDDCRSTSG